MSDGGAAPESENPRTLLLQARIGSVIAGKYRFDELLGEGAMGTVWAATHLNLGQRVAIKLISPEFASFKDARRRFEAEAKAAARIRSRFAVQIQDSGIAEDGSPYLVMEYLNGETLEQRVERQGPLPLEHALRIISQVARGLTRAHALNIIHRDLKPANVFLAETEDGEEVAKILDFGIAKVQDAPAHVATATGAVLGTPLFMSPEQARGLKTLDHRSDLYSLGMVAFRVLTGRYAFDGEAFGELLLAICTRPLPTLHQAAPWLPPTLDGWFQRACAREPADRYESAQAMIDALFQAAGLDATRLGTALGTSARSAAMLFSPELADSPNHEPRAGDIGAASGGIVSVPTATGFERVAAGTTGAVTRPSERLEIPKRSLLPLFAAGLLTLAAATGVAWLLRGSRVPAEGGESLPLLPAGAPAASAAGVEPAFAPGSVSPNPKALAVPSAGIPASAAPSAASARAASARPAPPAATPVPTGVESAGPAGRLRPGAATGAKPSSAGVPAAGRGTKDEKQPIDVGF